MFEVKQGKDQRKKGAQLITAIASSNKYNECRLQPLLIHWLKIKTHLGQISLLGSGMKESQPLLFPFDTVSSL